MLYIVMCNGSQKSCCMHAGCYFNTKISIYKGRTIGKAICNMDQGQGQPGEHIGPQKNQPTRCDPKILKTPS